MNQPARRAQRIRPWLHAAARFIQFRSELAILMVLGLGVAAGAAARHVVSAPGPSAGFAGSPQTSAERADEHPASRKPPPAPARHAP